MSTKNLALPTYGHVQPFIDRTGAPPLRDLAFGTWRTYAACNGHADDRIDWFAACGTLHSRRAIGVCEGCPVRRDCLAAAFTFGEEYGVWGGLDELARRRRTRELRAGTPLGRLLDRVLLGLGRNTTPAA